MTFRNDLSGQKFGRLTALFYVAGGKWECQCECGCLKNIGSTNLRKGLIKSCGCLAIDVRRTTFLTHGHSRLGKISPEYRAWSDAKDRCTNPKKINWHRYGGRGVIMCEEWMESFEAFLNHVGLRPSPKHSLDRYPNNNGNYEPGNVRWATREQQGNNTSSTRVLVVRGQAMSVTEASKKFGKHRKFISRRLDKGCTPEVAVGIDE